MIITIDPGEHIGIITELCGICEGRTIEGVDRNYQLWKLLNDMQPTTVIYEEFALRQSAANKLVGNKFITCEVIGVIKLYCQMHFTKCIVLQPSCKEFCGFSSSAKDPKYQEIRMHQSEKITEHVRDAYRLYNYARLFKL